MRIFNLISFKTALVCTLVILIEACARTVPGSWKNDKIGSGRQSDFHELNNEVLQYLKANDTKGLKRDLCKEMIDQNNDVQVEKISHHLADEPYTLLDEYYVVHKYKDTDTVRIESGNINRYNVLYPYVTTEMYFAFFVPKKLNDSYMISLVYGKFDYGWKIVKLDIAPYTINGKTAPELYALARQQYGKNQYQAALNNVTLAISCFKPCSYWRYPDEADASKLFTRAHAIVKNMYRYPMVLSQVSTGPMLLGIYTQKGEGGTYPVIYYMTHYDLRDTTAIKKENIQIRKAIDKIIPGLRENNKCVFYSAFNKRPSAYTSTDHFDMTDRW